jgi:LacI family transcriptional regulator
VSGYFDPAQLADLVKKHKLDAVMSYAVEHLEMLRDAGMKVPEDISYASLNVTEGNRYGLSGMRQSYFQVGAAAVNLVTKLYESNERGFPELPSIQYIESVWTEGKTVANKVPSVVRAIG